MIRLLILTALLCQAAGEATEPRRDMLIATGELAASLERPAFVVLHVGFPADAPDAAGRATYADGHIPGARRVEFTDVALTRKGVLNELPPAADLVAWVRRAGIREDSRIVLYDTGSGLEAARAYVALDYLGLGDRAALLDGHWKKWKAEGRSISREAPKVEPSSIAPRYRPEVLLSLTAMQDAAWLAAQPGSRVRLIDARPASEFTGDKPGKDVRRAGHIAGASSVWWVRNLTSRESPTLRPPAELDAMYRAAGAARDRIIAAYCRTGTEAAHTYFTLKYLGYDVRLYDGSMAQWAGDPESSVETGSGCEDERNGNGK